MESTVSRSSVELTAWPTSPSALSSPTERVSWAVRASSSVNRRTFSIAMTAWSAKVCKRAICFSGNRPGVGRPTVMLPIAAPLRINGIAKTLRKPPFTAFSFTAKSGSSSTSTIETTLQLCTARLEAFPLPTRVGKDLRTALAPSGSTLASADSLTNSPSKVVTMAELALHRFNAAAAIVSNTGCTSLGERLITRRISLVAVCRSSASFVSLNSRTFSIAITA